MQGSLIKFHILFHCLLDGEQFILSRGAPPLAMALVVYIPRRRLLFSTTGSGPSRGPTAPPPRL